MTAVCSGADNECSGQVQIALHTQADTDDLAFQLQGAVCSEASGWCTMLSGVVMCILMFTAAVFINFRLTSHLLFA